MPKDDTSEILMLCRGATAPQDLRSFTIGGEAPHLLADSFCLQRNLTLQVERMSDLPLINPIPVPWRHETHRYFVVDPLCLHFLRRRAREVLSTHSSAQYPLDHAGGLEP